MGLPTGAGRESLVPVRERAPISSLASMGLPTGAGGVDRPKHLVPGQPWLQWGCRPGPAESSLGGSGT